MLQGIDVSNWQGAVDWSKVKQSGIQWAGIKASQGTTIADGYFSANWQHAQLAGVRRIAYHFFDPALDGVDQANWFHSCVRNGGHFAKGDAAMLDIETVNGIDPQLVVARAESFVENILWQTGCGIYIYTGSYFWKDQLQNPKSKTLGKCPLWVASYGAAPQPIPQWSTGPSIWQYTAGLQIPGIAGPVDGDHFLGDWTAYNLLAQNGGRM